MSKPCILHSPYKYIESCSGFLRIFIASDYLLFHQYPIPYRAIYELAFKAMTETDDYSYTPSLIPAVIGVGLYFALFAGHGVRILRTQAWDGIYMLAGALGKSQWSVCLLYTSPSPRD